MIAFREFSSTFLRSARPPCATSLVTSKFDTCGPLRSFSARSITAIDLINATKPGFKLRETVNENQPIRDAAKLMRDNKWGLLIVVDDVGKRTGVIAEAEFLRGAEMSTPVNAVMTPWTKVITCPPTANAYHVMSLMNDNHIRHIPIIDDQGKSKGVLTVRDVLMSILAAASKDVDDMTSYIQGLGYQ